jgi:hypothetical protein
MTQDMDFSDIRAFARGLIKGFCIGAFIRPIKRQSSPA